MQTNSPDDGVNPITGCQTKFNAAQIEEIIDKLVPMIAEEGDREFFRGVLHIAAENQSSANFADLVKKLLPQ